MKQLIRSGLVAFVLAFAAFGGSGDWLRWFNSGATPSYTAAGGSIGWDDNGLVTANPSYTATGGTGDYQDH